MISSLKVVFVLSLAFVLAAAQKDDQIVNVEVYYESLCPDSIKFFTKQLYPAITGHLSNYVNLTLVPYGKSTMEFKANEYEFTCHHGPAECKGNKIHACALKVINKGENDKDLGFNWSAVGFINCLMDKVKRNGSEAYFPIKGCAAKNYIKYHLNDIENCAGHSDGSNYLAEYGALTKAFQEPLKSVPTIVFNNALNTEDSALAQTDFVKALCQYIPGEKPNECFGSYTIKVTCLGGCGDDPDSLFDEEETTKKEN